MVHRIFLLIFGLMLVGDVLWWRMADQKLRRLPRSRPWRIVLALYTALMVAYLASVLALPTVMRGSASPVPRFVHAGVYLWHFLVLPVTLLAFAGGAVARRAAAAVSWLRARPDQQEQQQQQVAVPHVLTRRQLLSAAAVSVPPLVMCGMAGVAIAQIGDLRVRRLRISLAALPPQLDGMTIAHVSDLHVGKFTRPDALRQMTDVVNGLRADFVAVTGDLIDMAIADLPQAIDTVRRIDPANGLFVCEGNHDLIEDHRAFREGVRRSGLAFLRENQQVVRFRGSAVQFLGAPWAPPEDLAVAVRDLGTVIQPGAFPILLAHHPHAFDPAASSHFPLTLSGHTHGGQIMLNERLGFGRAMFRYWSGLYRKGDAALVVSNGTGNWFPLRVHAPAEIVHITLTRLEA
jgi:predicted MPP superfamily phosphohydrolase